MVRFFQGIQTEPRLAVLNQIDTQGQKSNLDQATRQAIVEQMKKYQLNASLPMICLTDREDRYKLLEGIEIIECAKEAGLDRIWVFLVANQAESEEVQDMLNAHNLLQAKEQKKKKKNDLTLTAREEHHSNKTTIVCLSILEFIGGQDSEETAIANIPQPHHGYYDWDADEHTLYYSYFIYFNVPTTIISKYNSYQLLEYFDKDIAAIVGEKADLATFSLVRFVPEDAIVHELHS